jgi:hypothetical protein
MNDISQGSIGMKSRMENPATRLLLMAKAAAAHAKGNTERAVERLDKLLRDEDSAELERELTKNWRGLALKARIAEAFQILRSEGKLPRRAPDVPIRTTRAEDLGYDVRVRTPSPPPPPQPSKKLYTDVEAVTRQSILDRLRINGVALRDTLVADAWAWAIRNETEGRFVRELLRGMPHVGTVGKYTNDAEADATYERISAEVNANAA